MVGNLIHRINRQYNYKKRQTMVGNNTQKNRQYKIKKRQTMVGNIIHRKTDIQL